MPLVQSALLSLLDHVKHQRLRIEQVVEKTAHNPAKRYALLDRGFIREGYFADLVLVDTNQSTTVAKDNILYHCGWTPFINHQFSSSVKGTWVNGQHVFDGQSVIEQTLPSQRLEFRH